jgi:hypothetical protein
MKQTPFGLVKKIAHQASVAVFVVSMLVIFLVTFASYCDFGLHASQMEMESSDPN